MDAVHSQEEISVEDAWNKNENGQNILTKNLTLIGCFFTLQVTLPNSRPFSADKVYEMP